MIKPRLAITLEYLPAGRDREFAKYRVTKLKNSMAYWPGQGLTPSQVTLLIKNWDVTIVEEKQ